MGTNMTLRSLYVKNETFQDILRELSNSPLKAFAVRHIITYCPYLGVNMNVPWDKVATLLTHLRNVDHFSLQSQSFQYHASPTVPFQGISSSHTVTRLTLTRTLFKNPVHVLGFINAFPNLQNLAMDIVLWTDGIRCLPHRLSDRFFTRTIFAMRRERTTVGNTWA
ncbi:hypothetical protein BC835DRAFT_359686 [Cytidiella melzeri]|nr:hypothetical protein BC835DRAFT_359686 [Cytidiella melzeri]